MHSVFVSRASLAQENTVQCVQPTIAMAKALTIITYC